jgi:hypothetical protein
MVCSKRKVLLAGAWFVLREKYCWLVADKPSEQEGYSSSYIYDEHPSGRKYEMSTSYPGHCPLHYQAKNEKSEMNSAVVRVLESWLVKQAIYVLVDLTLNRQLTHMNAAISFGPPIPQDTSCRGAMPIWLQDGRQEISNELSRQQ